MKAVSASGAADVVASPSVETAHQLELGPSLPAKRVCRVKDHDQGERAEPCSATTVNVDMAL